MCVKGRYTGFTVKTRENIREAQYWRAKGLTLQQIGILMGYSRERIRQYLLHARRLRAPIAPTPSPVGPRD